ncbi:hypothetical protein MUO14_17390 [Halobacillus shinanisalinarum]|uniref:Uncharacterized protein n=1 Tax=Halobacillus shinanisalinarum TaxID=2932258 RepID=A0ABY4GWA5_9BACI|nr:hypothetical protein [Halobacillus shinanisalinarum]UOQ92241.1 hypothetical protein MUO14_17390 [Halobacillus shinanisalinarum]
MGKKKNFKVLSLVCLFICVLAWVPNIVFQVPSQLWMLTFVVSPIGVVFTALMKKRWLIVANTLMFLSFFLFMFAGYFVSYLTDGKL